MFVGVLFRSVWPTFGQSAGAEVVDVHDVSVHFQGDTLHRGLQLHAAVTDQHIHTAVTVHHLSHHLLHAGHITEVHDHQLWGKRLETQDCITSLHYCVDHIFYQCNWCVDAMLR